MIIQPSDYQPIITSTNKMAASCLRAFDEMKFSRVLQCFFFSFFGIIACVFILKQLFAEGEVIIGEEYSSIITKPEANNC